MIGYTDRQALRVLQRIDKRLARTEDSIEELAHGVEDHDESPGAMQELAREMANRQTQTIARRLRRPLSPAIITSDLYGVIDYLEGRIEEAQ